MKRLIGERIKKKVEENNLDEGAKLTQEELDAIKDAVICEELKNASPDEYYINAFFDTQNKLMCIDVSSMSKVDRLIDWIKRIDDTFTAKPFFDSSLEIYLTRWVYNPTDFLPKGLLMDQEATLKHDDNSKAVFSQQDLGSEELTMLLNHDKRVTELALIRDAKLAFKLKEDGSVRKLKPTDILLSEIDRPEGDESPIANMEVEMLAMSNELTQLYSWLEMILESDSGSGGVNPKDSTEQPHSTENMEESSIAELDTLTLN